MNGGAEISKERNMKKRELLERRDRDIQKQKWRDRERREKKIRNNDHKTSLSFRLSPLPSDTQ